MNIVPDDVFDAVRRGYASLETASNDEIKSYFDAIEPETTLGHVSHIKGILFEQQFVDALVLGGVEASLFEATNHPVTDVIVFGGLDGVSEISLKASNSVSYVTGAMEEEPEIVFAVTSEVAAQIGSDIVIDTGIENAALESAVEGALFEECISPIGALSILRFLIGIPL